MSEDGSGQNNPNRNEGPGAEWAIPTRTEVLQKAPRSSAQNEEQDALSEGCEGWRQTARHDDLVVDGKAPSDIPALKP
jgi:hypothetical protein